MTDKDKKRDGQDSKSSLTHVVTTQNPLSTHLLDDALKELSPENRQHLMAEASREALRLQAKTAEISIDEAAAHRETHDHVDAFNALDKSRITMGHKVTSEFRTGVGTRRIESKSGATCFVVTAACGDIDHELVTFYRAFRDRFLIMQPLGRTFVAWYYRKGPTMADYLVGHPGRRLVARLILNTLKIPCRFVLNVWSSVKR